MISWKSLRSYAYLVDRIEVFAFAACGGEEASARAKSPRVIPGSLRQIQGPPFCIKWKLDVDIQANYPRSWQCGEMKFYVKSTSNGAKDHPPTHFSISQHVIINN